LSEAKEEAEAEEEGGGRRYERTAEPLDSKEEEGGW
jgi:hypothetical protein